MDTAMDTSIKNAAHLEAAFDTTTATVACQVTPARRARALTYAGIGALVLAAAGTSAFIYYDGRVSTDDAQVEEDNAPIEPKVACNIVEILVDDKQDVTAGKVLLRIDPRDYGA